jgi:hypothetical protein
VSTRELLRDLNAQRRAVRWYQHRAKELRALADVAATGSLVVMESSFREAADTLEVAARREAEPERGT